VICIHNDSILSKLPAKATIESTQSINRNKGNHISSVPHGSERQKFITSPCTCHFQGEDRGTSKSTSNRSSNTRGSSHTTPVRKRNSSVSSQIPKEFSYQMDTYHEDLYEKKSNPPGIAAVEHSLFLQSLHHFIFICQEKKGFNTQRFSVC
jgi:hypothetical protein